MDEERGRWAKKSRAILVTLLLPITAIAALAIAREEGMLNRYLCEGVCPDEYATLPADVKQPRLREVKIDSSPAAKPDADAVAAAVAKPLANRVFNGEVSFLAVDPISGDVLVEHDAKARTPASTAKVLTVWAALELLGPDHRFVTTVRQQDSEITLVGGGDPYLTAKPSKRAHENANLRTLAKKVAKKIGREPVTLRADTSLFAGPVASSTWPDSYVPAVTRPVQSLGLSPAPDPFPAPEANPSGTALDAFAMELRRAGVRVKAVSKERGPAQGQVIAKVNSASLDQIGKRVLVVSDNAASEILLRHIALAAGEEPSFTGGTAGLTKTLRKHAISTDGLELHDGSGLSRENRIAPATLTGALVAASKSPRAETLVTGMPIAGLRGTLERRFGANTAVNGRGLVRAKTGSLTGVTALAGWAVTKQGHPIAFAIIADGIDGLPMGRPETAVDRVAAALANCAC